MRAAKAQSKTTNEFQLSNSTTNAFIGGTQKPWMTGQSQSARGPSIPKVFLPRATDQASKATHRIESAPKLYETAEGNGLPNTVFGPNFDRGRYPAQRPRHGATSNYANRSPTLHAAGSSPPVASPPTVEGSSYTLPFTSMDVSSNVENVLPSPSPSVDARQNSVTAMEAEDQGYRLQATEAWQVDTPAATLQDLVTRCGGMDQLEILLKEAGKSNHEPSQIAASAIAQGLPGTRPTSGSLSPRQPFGPTDESRLESNHGVPAPSIANKRPHEITDEPRKRLQSLPGSPFEGLFAIPSATTVLLSQNHQSGAAADSSGTEIRPFTQDLAQRMRLVANLRDREVSYVERSRLELLREAYENSDHFYLVLHQLFCFDHQLRKSNRQVPSLNETHRKGLDVVAFLLGSNDEMVDDAVAWFSVFPLPWDTLLLNRPEFRSAHLKVLRCLDQLAKRWAGMRSQCMKRRYPPLVDELIVLFNVESFLFQQIIFRALLRTIWSGKVDNCFLVAEGFFNRDHKVVMGRLSSGSDSVELAKAHQQTLIQDYQQLLGSHRQHIVAQSMVNLAAPVQPQSQSRLATANHCPNNRNRSQPEHNRDTQSPLTLDIRTAQRNSLSAASGPSPVAVQLSQRRQSDTLCWSQALAFNAFSSPHLNNFTQSPTTLQDHSCAGTSMNSPWQWNNQQQQRDGRTSSTAGNLRNDPASTAPTQRTPHVVPSNVAGNLHMHQFQQNIGPQQQSHNRVPSSANANPRPRRQPEVPTSTSNRATETTLRTLSPHAFIHPSPPTPTHATPFIRSYPPLPIHPNPAASALHQAHLRSPTLSYLDPSRSPSGVTKCYRFIKHVLMPPEELDCKNRHVNWDFSVNKELTDWFAHDAPNPYGAPPTRSIVPGSRLCRIRCVTLKDKSGMPTQTEWAVADNVWPGSTAVVLNGIALDIRKKTHHGKDLPVDVTRYIRAGQNNLSTAVIGFQKNSASRYAIGVEFIQVVDEHQLKSEIKSLPWIEARQRILDQSKNLDPDLEVIQSQKVLDLTDPFTARIFDVPVRGINCHHNQCFDRDTFLQTRTGKIPGEPCGPDEFRCPICGQDARPQSLMIDGFFLSVRMALKERDRLDVKAIILDESGGWEIREEEAATGESGDGTGRRSAGLAGARTASVSAARQSVPCEVIELDDD